MKEEDDARQAAMKRQQELEQGMTFVAESMPPLWRRLYLNLLKEGFETSQAMDILKTYIFGCAGGRGGGV